VLEGTGCGPSAARQAEAVLRLAFGGVWWSRQAWQAAGAGELLDLMRGQRAEAALLGPREPGTPSPLDAAHLHVGGSCVAWSSPGGSGGPFWILSPGTGELADGAELATVPGRLLRRAGIRRLSSTAVTGALHTIDEFAMAQCGAVAARLVAGTSVRPVLVFPRDRWPRQFEAWTGALARGLGGIDPAGLAVRTPEEAAYLLAGANPARLPRVLIAGNAWAATLAAVLAARHGPALTPRLLLTPTVEIAAVGHADLGGRVECGPSGFLAAAAALMSLRGEAGDAALLMQLLDEAAANPTRRPPELGGRGPAPEFTAFLNDRLRALSGVTPGKASNIADVDP
jgi:hypothetical protein